MYRKSFLEINDDNYRYNINYIRKVTGKKLIAVEKANGYSTEDVHMSRVAIEEGVDFIAVSSLEEAIHLRKNNIDTELLVLGYVGKDNFDLIRKYDLSIITLNYDFVKENISLYKGIKVHLKLNTGMNRLGILPSQAKDTLDLLLKTGAKVEGVMTHYACADSDEAFTKKQYQLFKKTVESLKYDFKYIHSEASDASLSFNDEISNYVRCGLAMYGYNNVGVSLKPCLSLYSEVSNVKVVPKGEGVSYGQHYTSDGEGYILTIPIGYADGFIRANTGKKVYVEDEEGIIVGSVCMDQLMVKTKKYHEIGSKVELFGEHISLEERAKELKTITYELICILSERLTRVFVSNGKAVETVNHRFIEYQ